VASEFIALSLLVGIC